MDIQQKEKESSAAYIHGFKREAKRCNFTNNAATIRIFVKGLKNTHTLATQVYEKGPQTLADTISEVEKLQAVQQLTATLLPSSTVNVMSYKEDQCFQCQELGHITCNCPNVHCFECDEYGHNSSGTAQTGYHHQACPHIITDSIPIPDIAPDQLLDATTGTDIGITDQGHNLNHIDIGVIVATTPKEAIPGHIIDIMDATIEALYITTTVLIA